MTTFYPLDIIRTHLQVDNSSNSSITAITKLIDEEGLGALYKGLGPVLFSLFCSNFTYFYTNNALKAIVKRITGNPVNVFQNLVVASLAGAVNVFATCPLWVANTRLKLQRKKSDGTKYTGLFDAVSKIAEQEGVLSLWNGCWASLVLVSNPTIQFVVYDKIKLFMERRALLDGRKYLNGKEIFLVGALAKAVATVMTYPIQLTQARMRATKRATTVDEKNKYRGTIDCLVKIFQQDGFLGWFRGLHVKIVQTVLTAAFQFLAYETIAGLIFRIMKLENQSKA
eukprot:TRINITY_DN10183_c0_g1_i1.p1 TRINITY_DN10183_c0_g1~~TRINITY_DN10183_c0_g1_i1.p1  ORF type:complete len:325 (-),score=76.05 TRINITY_DN10183_c0_g1_i1:57-905(-)